MFTPGSKYFLGLTGLSLVSAILYMVLVNPSDVGAVALFSLSAAAATIGGFALFTRDGDVWTADEAVTASTATMTPSLWPLVLALGVALTLVGLATTPAIFILGIAALVIGGVEWTLQNWADRASSEPAFNNDVRERVIGGLEYPGLAAVILVVIAFSFSRIMLAVSMEVAPIVFMIAAILVLVAGFYIASRPQMRGKLTNVIAVVATVLLLGTGALSAFTGERSELAKASKEKHFSKEHRECGEEVSKYYDKKASNNVSMRSGVFATIFVEDGKIYAQEIGLKKKLDTVTIARSNAVTVLFRNLDSAEHRLVVNLGEHKVDTTDVMEKVGTCTQVVGKNQEQALILKIAKPATPDAPYSFTVPGINGKIKLVVP